MKKIQYPALALATLVIALLTSGCVTKSDMDPAGPYMGDAVLFNADMIIPVAYNVIQDFVDWEYANRSALRSIPEIKKAADAMRREAPGLFSSAHSLREAYAKDPNPANRDSLENVLKLLRAFSVEATFHLTKQSN